MLNNLNTLTWLLKTKHACGKILMKDPMMMNEELGELTFSVLSRGQNSNPNRQHVKHVSKSYRKTRAQMQLAAELGVDLNSTDLAGGKGNTIKAASIADATNFFLGMLRDFKAGAWLPVDLIKLQAYTKGVDKLKYESCYDTYYHHQRVKVDLWDPQVTDSDMKRLDNTTRSTNTNKDKTWVFQPAHGNLWDEFKPDVKEAANDEDLDLRVDSDSGGEPEMKAAPQERKRRRAKRKQAPAKDSKAADGSDSDSSGAPAPASQRRRKAPAKERTYIAQKIVAEREMEDTDQLQYLIKWKGFPKSSSNTWEPADVFIGQPQFADMLLAFYKKRDVSQQ